MNLHYQYYWFKEVIPHDTCDKIIQMGNKRIEQVKKNGNAKKFIQFTENIDRKTLNAKADLICTDFKNVIDFINNDI